MKYQVQIPIKIKSLDTNYDYTDDLELILESDDIESLMINLEDSISKLYRKNDVSKE